MWLRNAFGLIATEETSQGIRATLQSLLETMRVMYRNQPRVSRDLKAVVDISETFGAPYTTSVINAVSNPVSGAVYYRIDEAFAVNRTANIPHYNSITRS